MLYYIHQTPLSSWGNIEGGLSTRLEVPDQGLRVC